MMDQHRSEYFAIPCEAFHPAFFSIADRLGCPEQGDCNGLILFGCVAIAERAIVPVYPESSLDHDSPQQRTLQVEDSTTEMILPLPERHKSDSLSTVTLLLVYQQVSLPFPFPFNKPPESHRHSSRDRAVLPRRERIEGGVLGFGRAGLNRRARRPLLSSHRTPRAARRQ